MIAAHGWPIRMHATYDETITHILDVFERVFDDTGTRPAGRSTTRRRSSRRTSGGSRRWAEGSRSRTGWRSRANSSPNDMAQQAAAPSPLRQLLDAGIPVGAGTDATRPSSYNPWLSLYWMVTGKTVGGTQIARRTTGFA